MNRFEFYDNVRKFKENQEENSLAHYGTKGQKWGERHWQNADGTFNEAGKERYFGSSGKKDLSKEKVGSYIDRSVQKAIEDTKRAAEKGVKNLLYQNEDGTLTKKGKKLMDKYDKNPEKYKDKFDKKINPDIIPDKDDKVSGLFKSKEEKELKKLEKEATRINENMNNSSWDKRNEIIKEILKDPKYKDTFDEIDAEFDKESEKPMHRTEEIFNDFKENETLNLATAGITNMFNTGYYPNPTMEDLGRTSWSYIYDDGNQGDNTAEYLYATIDKQVSSKELNELYKQLHSKTDFLNNNAIKLKEDVRFKNIDERNLKKIIDKKLDNKYQDNKAYWNLYAANEGWRQEPDDKLKKNYSEAKNITKKLQPSCGNSNGWDYLNKAIENLDLSATELKNMTQSDWDRVNAEVNRLKK